MRNGPASERGRTAHLESLYPELAAGGFSRVDGTVAFYSRVLALMAELEPGGVVVDFGAGRGSFLHDPVPFRRDIRLLRGRGPRVVGVDVDRSVLENPAVDEGHVIEIGGKLPFEDGSVGMIVSDHTFEHVTDPESVARELDRVLRPGGWLCARTPNRWGYIGIGANAVPNRLHVAVLRYLQPTKAPEDTFPTAYRLNTRRALATWFPPQRYHHIIWPVDNEPAYVGHSGVAAKVTRGIFAMTPPPFRSIFYVFLRKALVST